MTLVNDRRFTLIFVTVTLCLLSWGCATPERAVVEAPPSMYQPSPPAPEVKIPKVRVAPKPVEVEAVVNRVFKGAAAMDSSVSPNFLTGDFNGDGSEDIVVVVKPNADKLNELNEQYPAWLLRDPTLNAENQKPQLRVEQTDVMLAVIHGFGANDWRDDQATQTYLLKNVVGQNMEVCTGEEFVKEQSGRKLPRPKGDLLGANLRGSPGYLYYTRSDYSWYDPKTFKGDTVPQGMFHTGRSMSK
jgi:hypothetical protein